MRGETLSPVASGAGLTVGAATAGARAVLERAGLADAAREAAELYACLVHRPASAAWLDRDGSCEPALAAALAEAARRRAGGWPQAYAAGWADFRGIWLAVDARVLIPRPETEGLVDVVLGWLRGEGAGSAAASPLVVDAGTGSGAIAIALALESPARVVATDSSAAALEVARANVAAHGLAGRVDCRQGDFLAPLGEERADVVVGNPPYVATAEWERLEPGVRDHEPRAALDGGADGLGPTRRLVAAAYRSLRAGGRGLLALEVDAARAGESAAVAAAAGFVDCVVLEDLFGRPRYLRARRPA